MPYLPHPAFSHKKLQKTQNTEIPMTKNSAHLTSMPPTSSWLVTRHLKGSKMLKILPKIYISFVNNLTSMPSYLILVSHKRPKKVPTGSKKK